MRRRLVWMMAALLGTGGRAPKKPGSANEYFVASLNLRQGSTPRRSRTTAIFDEYPFSEYMRKPSLIAVAHYKTGSCSEATA
jgi:hypothetical protein